MGEEAEALCIHSHQPLVERVNSSPSGLPWGDGRKQLEKAEAHRCWPLEIQLVSTDTVHMR